jgi:Domain of unknown function (DUF4416)
MAEPQPTVPVLLVVAAFSRHGDALQWVGDRLEQLFGKVALVSPTFEFHQTHYYEATMGAGLLKRFLVFHELIPGDQLADIKRQTNDLEAERTACRRFQEPRPVNIDPGILVLGKFCLATTKDQQHRIYLREGIYAEVTLRFQAGAFEPWPWTYADYREEGVRSFLKQARNFYRRQLRELAHDDQN